MFLKVLNLLKTTSAKKVLNLNDVEQQCKLSLEAFIDKSDQL